MAQSRDDYDDRDDLGWFRDELRQRDRDIAELRAEKDRLTDQITRFAEYVEDYNGTMESWRDAFGMVQADNGAWTWKPFWNEYLKLIDHYGALVKRWNKAVPVLNAGLQDVGRPLAASEAQAKTVAKLHKQGKSLRGIVEETNLSLRTVRTIVGRLDHSDRASKKRLQRIDIGPDQTRWRRQRRTGDQLPKQVQALIETGNDLVKEAKGLA
jgi:hypothetical protein